MYKTLFHVPNPYLHWYNRDLGDYFVSHSGRETLYNLLTLTFRDPFYIYHKDIILTLSLTPPQSSLTRLIKPTRVFPSKSKTTRHRGAQSNT